MQDDYQNAAIRVSDASGTPRSKWQMTKYTRSPGEYHSKGEEQEIGRRSVSGSERTIAALEAVLLESFLRVPGYSG